MTPYRTIIHQKVLDETTTNSVECPLGLVDCNLRLLACYSGMKERLPTPE